MSALFFLILMCSKTFHSALFYSQLWNQNHPGYNSEPEVSFFLLFFFNLLYTPKRPFSLLLWPFESCIILTWQSHCPHHSCSLELGRVNVHDAWTVVYDEINILFCLLEEITQINICFYCFKCFLKLFLYICLVTSLKCLVSV